MEKHIALLSMATIAIALSFTMFVNTAFAQTNPTPTPAQLQECHSLGIPAGQCSDLTIKSKLIPRICYVPCNTAPSSGGSPASNFDPTVFVLVGLAIAFAAGIVAVKKLGRVRKQVNRSL